MSRDPPEYQTVLLNAPPPYEASRAPCLPAQLRHDPNSIDTAYNPGQHRPNSAGTQSSRRLNRVARGSTVRDYKPAALRWWFHLLLIACLGGLMGLTEYAVRNLVHLNDSQTTVIMRRDSGVVLGDTMAVMDSLFHLDLGRRADDGGGDDDGASTTVVTVSPPGGAGPVTIAVAIPIVTHGSPGWHHPAATELPSAAASSESSTDAVQTAAAASWTTASATLASWTTTWTTTWSSEDGLTTSSTSVSAFPIRQHMDVETVTTIWTDADGAPHTSSYETTTCRDNDTTTSTVALHKDVASSAKALSGQAALASVEVLYLSDRDYLTGAFLATALAVLVAYPLNLISASARRMQPFHALATASAGQGAAAAQSLLLRFHDGPAGGALSLARALLRHPTQPAVALSDLLLLPAALLPPLAATAVSLRVGDACLSLSQHLPPTAAADKDARAPRPPHCLGLLGVSPAAARGLQALLAAAVVLLAALLLVLSARRWRTGVARDPWSPAAMARLCRDPELRARLRRIPRGLDGSGSGCGGGGSGGSSSRRSAAAAKTQDVGAGAQKVLGGARYALGRFWGSRDTQAACPASGPTGYGVMVAGPAAGEELHGLQPLPLRRRQHHGLGDGDAAAGRCTREGEGELEEGDAERHLQGAALPRKKSQPFAVLTWWGRCGLLVVFSGVLALVACYYESTRAADAGFEGFAFVSSQAWGFKFLFTAIGVALGFLMGVFFRSQYTLSPPPAPQRTISLSLRFCLPCCLEVDSN